MSEIGNFFGSGDYVRGAGRTSDTPDTNQAATCPSFNETDWLRHGLDWIANHATTLEEAQALARRTYGEHPSAHPVSAERRPLDDDIRDALAGAFAVQTRNALSAITEHLTVLVTHRLAAAEARVAEAERERDENEGVIKVWRRRTEEAEAENERLREALERLRAEFIEHADGIEEADRDDDPLSEAATARMESYREFVSRLALLTPKHPQDKDTD